ncbi:hypothetical protein HanIR_Chr03g0131371 [Helianthus annuus]|nr:hypothetical protein HanIR_Chr03g0131371 [Helianthus annuus]
MLVSHNNIRCNLSRIPECIFTFAMNGPDQILNYGRCNWIKSRSWFIIQKHLFMIAAQHTSRILRDKKEGQMILNSYINGHYYIYLWFNCIIFCIIYYRSS